MDYGGLEFDLRDFHLNYQPNPLAWQHVVVDSFEDSIWKSRVYNYLWPKKYDYSDQDMSGRDWELTLPSWSVIAITAIPPILWFRNRTLRRRQIAAGICQKCGYDLRATPNLCPERGSIPEKPAIPYNPQRSIK